MKKHVYSLNSLKFYSVLLLCMIVVLWFLVRVVFSLTALAYFQTFTRRILHKEVTEIPEELHENAVMAVSKAIRYDGNNAEYMGALGGYLNDYYGQSQGPMRKNGLKKAEYWIKKAIIRDPASPWYYYELGRLEQYRGSCPESLDIHTVDQCPVSRYFRLALQQAPGTTFLREVVSLWFYRRNPELAVRLIRENISRYAKNDEQAAVEFSQFLYDIGLDYFSDRNLPDSRQPPPGEQECEALLDYCTENEFLEEPCFHHYLEFGQDDGTDEWRSPLFMETDRVKKTICLPENLDDYSYAAVKILMRHGGSQDFIARISVDDHLIKTYDHDLPREKHWHQIPFDIDVLQGKSAINVYLRVSGTSGGGNFLQLFGDQDTEAGNSVFNMDQHDDLSLYDGTQRGEYMIRLVLGKIEM